MIELTLDQFENKIKFDTFLKVLSIFHPKTEKERKMKCFFIENLRKFSIFLTVLFRMFDIDEDDVISMNDLVDFYRLMFIESYKEKSEEKKLKDDSRKTIINENVIQKTAKEMLTNFDLDGDKALNYEEFRKVDVFLGKIKLVY